MRGGGMVWRECLEEARERHAARAIRVART
jgi:hypothetical protein